MTDRSVRVRFTADIGQWRDAMRQAGRDAAEFGRNLSGFGDAKREEMERLGRSALLMSAGVGAAVGLTAKAAMDWESSWAGVTKTVDGTEAELADLEDGLRGLATELPATHGEIAAVAEAAGQLGVERGSIESFTRTMIDLGETTNLTADEAASAIARMTNIMQTAPKDVERLGSALVALGNDGASTERDIIEMSLRISGAGKQIGLSEDQVLAFANALSSVGVEVEAGGSAISRTFIDIANSVASSDEKLEDFAKVAGMSTAEFSGMFQRDAAGAVVEFIEGLDRMASSGQNVFGILEDLGITEQRQRDALLRAAGAGDLFRESLELGADAWEENNALATEAEKRYATTAAQLEILRNNITEMAIDVGDRFLPALSGGAEAVGAMARGMGELPGAAQTGVAALGGLTTAGLGVVGLLGVLGPKVKAAQDALNSMGSVGQFAARNLGTFSAALGIAGVAVAGLTYALGKQAQQQAEAQARAEEYTQAIIDQDGAIGDLNVSMAGEEILAGKLGDKLREAGIDLQLFGRSLLDTPDAFEALGHELDQVMVQLSGSAGEGLADALKEAGLAGTPLAEELIRVAEAAGLSKDEIQSLVDRLDEEAVALARGVEGAKNHDYATKQAGDSASDAGANVDGFTDDIDDNAQAMEEAKEAAKRWREGVELAFAPLEAQANLDRFTTSLGQIGQTFADAEKEVADIRARMAEVNERANETEADLAARIRDAERAVAEARAAKPSDGKAEQIRDAEQRLAELRSQVGKARIDANEEIASLEEDLQVALEDTSRVLDGNSEAAIRNRDLLLQATQDATSAIEAAAADQSVSLAELEEMRDNAIVQLEKEAERLGLSKEEVGKYTAALEEIPLGELRTTVVLDADEAITMAERFRAIILELGGIEQVRIGLAAELSGGSQEVSGTVYGPGAEPEGRASGGPMVAGRAYITHANELVVPAEDKWVYDQYQTQAMFQSPPTMTASSGIGGSTANDYSRHVEQNLTVQVLPTEDPHAAGRRSLRKLAAAGF